MKIAGRPAITNPLQPCSPYVLYKALPQAKRYYPGRTGSCDGFAAMRCNQRLVSSGLDEALVLQQALVQIVCATPAAAG